MVDDPPRKRGPKYGGRHHDLTPAIETIICNAVRNGQYASTAAQAAGIARSTFNRWMLQGEQGEEPFATFRANVKKADAEGEAELVRRVLEAGKEDPKCWAATMRILAAKYKGRYAEKSKAEMTHKLDPSMPTDEKQLESMIRKLLGEAHEEET